jgi:hypothetical protein
MIDVRYEGRERFFVVGNPGFRRGEGEFFDHCEEFGSFRVVFYNTSKEEMDRIRGLVRRERGEEE